jgi:hypothetical protein
MRIASCAGSSILGYRCAIVSDLMESSVEVNMGTRLIAAMAALWLVAAPARAEVVQASSTTVVTAGQAFRAKPGVSEVDLKLAAPVYELVSVSASEIRTGWGEFQAVLSGWGALDAGPIRFWQNGAPAGSRATGDVDVGYLRGDLLGNKLTFRLGRQMIVEGGARMIHLDGAQLVLRLPLGFGLSGYGGAPVAPRFDARGTVFATGSSNADVAYGGRVSWRRGTLVEIGASVSMANAGSQVSRQEAGADLKLAPVHGLEILGSGFYSLYDSRLAMATGAVQYQLLRNLRLLADVQRLEPDLFLPRNSILAVFMSDGRTDGGGGVHWLPLRTLTVDAGYHYLGASDGSGSRVQAKGVFTGLAQTSLGADLQYLKIPDSGYTLVRLFGSREWGRVTGTLDLWMYRYEKKVNDQDQSLGATLTGGYQLAPAWKVLLAATAGADPFYKSRLDVMAKLVWNQLFVREVR